VVEACIITNGRSTFEYALECLKNQTYKVPITIIENRKWVSAVNDSIKFAIKDWVLRVDDDMFLHPRAVEFMVSTLPRKSVMHRAQLYEHHSKMVAGRVKIYNVWKVNHIGGFRPNKLGKIDRTFEEDVKKTKFKISIADKKSPVGLHACAPWEEQLRYEELWGHKKSRRNSMRKYPHSVEWQHEKSADIIERYNRRNNTGFWEWLNR